MNGIFRKKLTDLVVNYKKSKLQKSTNAGKKIMIELQKNEKTSFNEKTILDRKIRTIT